MNIIEKVKLLFKLKGIYSNIKEVSKMKTGWKTTEFWMAIITIVVSLWMALKGLIPATIVAEILKWVGVVYIIARTIVKATPTTKDDELLDKIEAIVKEKTK